MGDTAPDRGQDRIQAANELLTAVRGVPPQHASDETVALYERALALVDDRPGSPLWYEVAVGLASHLLELPDGDLAAHRRRARELYARVLARAEEDEDVRPYMVALSGIGTSVTSDPDATDAQMGWAIGAFDDLVSLAREHAPAAELAVYLGQAAHAHSQARAGDVDHEMEVAIRLRQEAVEVLLEADAPDVQDRLGRAYHNLARLHAERRTGMRAQNVDRAIHCLRAALELRTADRDPVGRARTLRALAVMLPEWSGADSLDHARRLAEEAADEADELARTDEREARRQTEADQLRRERLALQVDLGDLYRLPPDDRRTRLEALIQHHAEVLATIDPDRSPAVRAAWLGGTGRLLGRLCHLGADADVVRSAYACFQEAVSLIDAAEHPRLHRDIQARWGELAHEIGDFPTSMATWGEAAEASRRLLADISAPDHRHQEIASTRGYGQFAAYAAVRTGHPEMAVRFAEMECTRGTAELFGAVRGLTAAGSERAERIRSLVSAIRVREASLPDQAEGLDGALLGMRNRLADTIGIDPDLIQMRRIDEAAHEPDPHADERIRAGEELAALRTELRALTRDQADRDRVDVVDLTEIRAFAWTAQVALVYLLGTVHGGAALVVTPDGSVESLLLDGLTSDVTGALLNGTEASPGFLRAAFGGLDDPDVLDDCLERITDTLDSVLMEPLERLLAERGVRQAVIVGLGRLGVLPIHLVAGAELSLSFAPSARALAAVPAGPRGRLGPGLVVADPSREDLEPLRFAVVEARWLAALLGDDQPVTVLTGDDASLSTVTRAAPESGFFHLACHGRFRPSSPLESHLFLAGEDELTVASVLSGEVDVGGVRLVTMSACESGTVESRRTPDEAIGFPTVLMLAGVPTVVGTAWEVGDAATMFFMARFYEILLREDRTASAAVAGAAAWLRNATAEHLLDQARAMGDHLLAEDGDAREALQQLISALEEMPSKAAPFARPSDWGAFFATGR